MNKTKTKAIVISQDKLSEGIYDLGIATALAADAHPGQFVGVYTRDRSKLLPRPISICETYCDPTLPGASANVNTANVLRLVYRVTGPDTGTEDISHLQAGDEVYLLGVLGNGYDVNEIVSKYRHPVLMGGGIGIPPMLELAKRLTVEYLKNDATLADGSPSGHDSGDSKPKAPSKPTVAAILGYRDSDTFLSDDFKAVTNMYIATEDGSVETKGNVLDVMRSNELMKIGGGSPAPASELEMHLDLALCDVILACGPMPMLRAIAAYAKEHGIKAYVSLEERMACGVGACLGCIVETREVDEHSHVHNARICTEGPVFDIEDLIL